MSTVTIRPAVPSEKTILSFIQALADYEHMSDHGPELLREWIFEKKKAEVIFAAAGGREVGFALFFHNFSTSLAGRASIWRTCLSCLRSGARGTARLCCGSWPRHGGAGLRAAGVGLDWNQPSIDFYIEKRNCAHPPWRSGPPTA